MFQPGHITNLSKIHMQEIKSFKKILVANRGEIAIRVLRAASELNIRTVTIFTYEDRYSLHRYKADEAYQVGADDEPLKPYLNIEAIITLAKKVGVEAIHPGYGFLSENVDFVRRCTEEGIVFIGPSAEAMQRVGDKVEAKKLAREVNVPLIEDSQGELNSKERILEEVQRIGFPIMIKAVAGGGGRGMRVTRNLEEFWTELKEAQREAKTAFGNDEVFLEKYIENPKHIEIQILGDHHGQVVHFFERDCSVQRRFQKVVEVAPSQGLKQETLDKLYAYALALGNHVGYNNAGTVEFLVDNDENIYFIEINPRIQVEHTITEEITGYDLVRSQILIAMGYSLHDDEIGIAHQDQIRANGFAIQCRVTTEDPANNFVPDYGNIIAYRSPGGFGIRLDAGNAYPGAKISPFFDSLLVKVTASGNSLPSTADRLHRALREFRVRGVKTNIGFLLNLLKEDTFRSGAASVNYISAHPELLEPPGWRNRSTRLLRYLAHVIVNGNKDVSWVDPHLTFLKPVVPPKQEIQPGTKQILEEKGPQGVIEYIQSEQRILYTDTTFRDAHQSLLATRMRTIDMLNVADSYASHHGQDLFSMEVWGGATFDVAMRFLKESPWTRLQDLRRAIPNTLLQMLLRGSNAVGYTAYHDNLIKKFIVAAAENGIDVFRIFDSLNWLEAMNISIETVVKETESIAEVSICYTGDVSNPNEKKFNLTYYQDLAKRIEDSGAHILAIKDMAGLLKPRAATILIKSLKQSIDLPIHLHTHDTSSIQAATYLSAVEAGVDIIDTAISSMSGLTSQPNFNSIIAMLEGNDRERQIDLNSLNQYSAYWESVRQYYYPFETELRSGTAEVYDHEIPGGQYSNLRPQARSLGLEDRFEEVKKNYALVNDLFGGIVKVTPSSKVVGDLAIFMTTNNLTIKDLFEKGEQLAWPESVKNLMRGNLGQMPGGFPEKIQKIILQGEVPFTERPNAYLEPVDFEKEYAEFINQFGDRMDELHFLSYKLYPKVFTDFFDHYEQYGDMTPIPTLNFFYGMKPNEEIMIKIGPGKTIIVKYLNITEPNEQGNRLVFFQLNGQTRAIAVHDLSLDKEIVKHRKAEADHEIGSPLQGSLSKVLVQEGDAIEKNQPLFTLEAMKMESTVSSPKQGRVVKVHLPEKSLVDQGDLVIELDE